MSASEQVWVLRDVAVKYRNSQSRLMSSEARLYLANAYERWADAAEQGIELPEYCGLFTCGLWRSIGGK